MEYDCLDLCWGGVLLLCLFQASRVVIFSVIGYPLSCGQDAFLDPLLKEHQNSQHLTGWNFHLRGYFSYYK